MSERVVLKSPRGPQTATIDRGSVSEEKRYAHLVSRGWKAVAGQNTAPAEPVAEVLPPAEKSLEKMNKAELQEICVTREVEFSEEDTKAVLIEKIRALGNDGG